MNIGRFIHPRLENVAPLCTIETNDWTGSTSGEVLFTGDGTTVDFSGKVDLPPVNPLNSFTLHYTIGGTSYSVTADEDGNLSDANMTGTINQDGTYEFHFNTPPDDTTDGTADYSYGIPPSNLGNALDPNNPNPSDWGWKTTTGADRVGRIKIRLQSPGLYAIGIRAGYKADSASGSLQVSLMYHDKISSGEWVCGELQRSLTVATDERIRTSMLGFYKYDPDETENFSLSVWVNAANTWYIRFYNICVFKIS